MRKRIIKVITVYDLDDPELEGMTITPIEDVQRMVEQEMEDLFCEDEGWLYTDVEVTDE